jgi:hypothetical protein
MVGGGLARELAELGRVDSVGTGTSVVVCDIGASVRPNGCFVGRRRVNVW